MSEKNGEMAQDEKSKPAMDRRSAAKMIGKYAAYTPPVMAVLLNAEKAEAHYWAKNRFIRRRNKGDRPSPS